MSRSGPSTLMASMCLGLLIALAYGGSLTNQLVFDDAIFMERDPRVASFDAARALLVEPLWGFQDAPGRGGTHQYYRPLQLLPLVVSNAWFGGAAWPCHAISLAMHFMITMLLFSLISILTGARTTALALAAVFAVHPGTSEAVLWVADFAGLGVAFATLSVLLVHARGRSVVFSFAATGLLALVGMFSKESGILILILMLAYDLVAQPARRRDGSASPRRRGAVVAGYAGAALATAAYLYLRRLALGGMLPGADALELTTAELMINAIALLPSYFATYLWPVDLNMYHDFEVVRSVGARSFLGGCAIVAAGVMAVVASARRNRIATFGLLFAAVAVGPYLLVRWPQLNAYAERYTYLPSVGLLLALGALLSSRETAKATARVALVSLSGLLIVFVWLDRVRAGEWRDEVTLYEKTLTQSQRAELIRNNLALRYLSEDRAELGIPLQERLLEIDPNFRSGWHNLGLLYLAEDRTRDALAAFERSVANEPSNAASWLNLGYVRDASGRRIEAIDAYCRATIFDPREAKAFHNLAVIALELGQPRNALAALEHIRLLGAEDATTRQLRASAEARTRREPIDAHRIALVQQLKAARSAIEAGRYIAGECALHSAMWLDETAHLPHHFLANAHYLRGRHRDALASERRALERAPNSVLYKKNVESLQTAPSVHGGKSGGGFAAQ